MEAFIRNVTEQMRCVKARDSVAQELSDHIEDQAAVYEEAGETHEEAVRKAVLEMGDPVEVGVEMDRIHRPQADFRMIAMAFAFSVAGFLITCSVESLAQHPEYIMRQGIVLLLSFGVMAGIYFLDYSVIGRYAYGIYAFVTIAVLIGQIFGARSGWDSVTFTLAYLYVPLYAGILYRQRGRGYRALAWGSSIQITMMLFVLMMGVSLFAAVNIYMMCTVLLVIAVWKGWFAVNKKAATVIIAAGLVLLPAALVIMKIVFSWNGDGFREQRLMAYIHPERYAAGAGYTYCWIRQEWSAVKLIGASDSTLFTDSSLIWPYFSEPFILLHTACKYGVLASLPIILAFAAVIMRAFHIVRRQKNQLGFMIAAACFIVFLVNCMEGVLINTGYYPVSAIQLPFVSCGACTAMTYAALIGLLLSIYRNERIITDKAVMQRPVWRLSVRLEKR